MFKYPFSGRGTMLMTLLLAMAWWVIAIVGPVMAQAPELQISIIPGRQQVQPGETLTYTIQYTNSGAAVASNVTIIGALLPKEQVNAITGDYQSDDRESGVVTWNIGELAPETEDKKQLNVTIADNAAGELSINVEIRVDNEPIDSSLASVQVTSPTPATQPPESPEVTATPVISTPVPADTPTPVPADTATPPPTVTPTPVPTDTPTPLPSNTPTSTQTPTPSPTHTPTPVPTNTPTPTPTVVPPAPPQPLSAIDLLYYGLIFVVIFAAVALIVVGIIFILHRRKGTPPSSIESPTPTIPPPPSPPVTSVTAYLECPARTTEPRRISLRNLDSGGEVIGRAMPETGITLRIDGTFPHWETVGRHHARIYRDSGTGKVIIEDSDSKNGVYVQGQRIAKLNLLKDGWQVAIGGVEFVYRESQSDSLYSPDVEKGVANE